MCEVQQQVEDLGLDRDLHTGLAEFIQGGVELVVTETDDVGIQRLRVKIHAIRLNGSADVLEFLRADRRDLGRDVATDVIVHLLR